MNNYSSQQKPYYPGQQNGVIEVEEVTSEEMRMQSTQRLVYELSDRISRMMFPLYDSFKSQSQSGKIMGIYPVLKLPSSHYQSTPIVTKSIPYIPSSSLQPSLQQRLRFQQLSKRVEQKQKIQYQAVSEMKIHQLLDQNEERQNFDDDMQQEQQEYGSGKAEYNKFKKARRYYEKLTREIKSNKKLKRRFKDKNRPKKAKSAYNLFVEQVVPQIKAKHPSFSAPNLVRVAAKLYNQLTQQEKKPYQKRYLIDKERFQRQREAYFRQHPEMDYRMDARQKASYMNDKYMRV